MIDDRPRPYWQTTSCPAWCDWAHLSDDHPSQRDHIVWGPSIPLTLAVPDGAPVGHPEDFEPPTADVGLVQGQREHEPRVRLSLPKDCDELTLGEALRLAEAIVQTARQAPEWRYAE